MAIYQNLINTIASNITTNGNNEITGSVLKSVLNSIVNVMGANATFGGVAHIADSPGTPDGPVVYIASEVGTYPNFGGLAINTDELAVFIWDTSTWTKESITYIADKTEIEQLIQDGINDIGDAKTDALDAIASAISGLNIYYDEITE